MRVWVAAEQAQDFQHVGTYCLLQFEKAAAKRAEAKASAAGDDAPQLKAKRMLADDANDGQIQYWYTAPQDSDACLYEAPLPDVQYGEVAEYDDRQLAIAATVIDADLVGTASF